MCMQGSVDLAGDGFHALTPPIAELRSVAHDTWGLLTTHSSLADALQHLR